MIKSKRMRLTGPVARKRKKQNVYWVVVGKLEGKRPLRRPRRGWENDIKIDLRELGWSGVNWIYPAQDRDQWMALVNTVMNLRTA
jgi:hypothetical protein